MTTQGLGYLPDPYGIHNRVYAGTGAGLAKSARTSLDPAFVLDQQSANSCVSHVIVLQARHLYQRAGVGNPLLPCRLQNYRNARIGHGAEDQDKGTYPYLAYTALRDGFCAEKHWPYDPNAVFDKPPTTVYKYSYDRSAEVAKDQNGQPMKPEQLWDYKIGEDKAERHQRIREAVSADLNPGVGLLLDNAFMRGDTSGYWVRRGSSVGRHYVLIYGYDDRGVLVRSSWSDRWALKGDLWVSWEQIERADEATDVTVLQHIPLAA